MITKKFISFITLLLIFGINKAEGQNSRMIIPSEISHNLEAEIKEMGAKMSAKEIYDPVLPSINDAVIQFNGGCTGEVVSPKGLIFTNHHCGYGAIQSHSTFEHNYVKDGFWAKSFSEELPNKGMYVTFVRKIQEVTSLVLQGINDDMDENIKQSNIQKNINKLKNTLPKEAWQDIEIKSFYNGNKYYAFIEENYKDIRLVGAPPSSIGKFGADTDNWMWPRHSGDFSIFRIYADKNNHPAEYSPENVPYKANKYFKISLKGVREGDFFLIYGFPGRTQEYLPAVAVEQKVNTINPARIEIRKKALDVLDKFMQKNDTIKLQYTAKYARIANYWKKWIGESQGINKTKAVLKKQNFENEFLKNLKLYNLDNSYKTIFYKFKDLYKQIKDPELARNYFIEIVYLNNDLLKRSFTLYNLESIYQSKGEKAFVDKIKSAKNTLKNSFNNYNAKVDKELFETLMKLYINKMPDKYLDSDSKNININELSDEIYNESVLNNKEKIIKLLNKNPKKFIKNLKEDNGYQFAKKLIDNYYYKISVDYNSIRQKINILQKKYIKGILKTSKRIFPDANGTLRISYGVVEGYEPRDAVYYYPVSHLKGVVEKYIPDDYEFNIPKKLLSLYRKKDFKPYSTTGAMPVDFLGSAHTTGGNSGSPAINKEGDLIGINFDRVWEGTMSDLFYNRKICRNIMVDIRYVLFIIDKFAKNKRLIDEIEIKK